MIVSSSVPSAAYTLSKRITNSLHKGDLWFLAKGLDFQAQQLLLCIKQYLLLGSIQDI